MENKVYMNLANLFEDDSIQSIKVPSYQRAYSWEEKQLEQFIGDILEMFQNEKQYYFGHFIFEKDNKTLYVIDGQQRITTFILFLIALSRISNSADYKKIIDKFSTVDYDDLTFSQIKNHSFQNFENDKTLSISRMEFAINYFVKLFQFEKLQVEQIDYYLKILQNAHISSHITYDKAVAVQIFELHNSRGVKLNTIEKVKSKLMKALYLNAGKGDVERLINDVQKSFGEIYHLEEKTNSTSFRGNLSLEEILLIHLRMIDDGSKLNFIGNNKHMFNNPTWYGNREDIILDYIDQKLNQSNSIDYILNLVKLFKKSVEFICVKVPEIDAMNHLYGDVIIFERNLSLSFFMLLNHLNLENKLSKHEKDIWSRESNFIKNWEKLLFTRDFHGMYYGLRYKDDFEDLYYRILTQEENVKSTIDYFLQNSFRPTIIKKDLRTIVLEYATSNKNNILQKAFNWHKEKMIYLLYKYETNFQPKSRNQLREIMKKGVSVEHVLPREWSWDWIKADSSNLTKENYEFNKEILEIIDGIGNLLILSPSENSSQSNSHPKEKYYTIDGYSYNLHNENREKWENHEKWKEYIFLRGEEIYDFLTEFIKEENT